MKEETRSREREEKLGQTFIYFNNIEAKQEQFTLASALCRLRSYYISLSMRRKRRQKLSSTLLQVYNFVIGKMKIHQLSEIDDSGGHHSSSYFYIHLLFNLISNAATRY